MKGLTRRLNKLTEELIPAKKHYMIRFVASSEEAHRMEAERKAEEGADYRPADYGEIRYICGASWLPQWREEAREKLSEQNG